MNMNKSLIALAVAGVFATSTAMAAVSLYGQANVSYDVIDNDGKGNLNRDSQGVASNGSRFGIKGSEALGNGLAAIWQIESSIAIGAGNGQTGDGTVTARNATRVAQRDTFAGLKSDTAGTIRLGRFDTPYKLATRGMDLFHNTVADNRSLMGIGHDARTSNTVGFNSLNYSGFSVAGSYFGDQGGTAGRTQVAGNSVNQTNEGVSLAAMYEAGGIGASLAYQSQSNELSDAVNLDTSAWKAGVSYTTNLFGLNGAYEIISRDGGSGSATAFYLSALYNVSSDGTLKLAFADLSGNAAKASRAGAQQYSFGYDHKMSNHTTLYALYSMLNNDRNAAYQLGMNSASSSVSGAAAGKDPSVFSVGMKHSF